jgi:hypothetical protein
MVMILLSGVPVAHIFDTLTEMVPPENAPLMEVCNTRVPCPDSIEILEGTVQL